MRFQFRHDAPPPSFARHHRDRLRREMLVFASAVPAGNRVNPRGLPPPAGRFRTQLGVIAQSRSIPSLLTAGSLGSRLRRWNHRLGLAGPLGPHRVCPGNTGE